MQTRLLQNDASARFDAWYATHNLLIDAQVSSRGNSVRAKMFYLYTETVTSNSNQTCVASHQSEILLHTPAG